MAGIGNYRHGHKSAGGCSPEWSTYYNMRARCTNPNAPHFDRYGGRGIMVCDRWLNGEDGMTGFECFLKDMGPKPGPGREWQIEREDNSRGYEPSNCRWATAREQANNRRSSRLLTAFGETMTLSSWAGLVGISIGTLHARLKMGWSDERAISKPLRGDAARWPYGLPRRGEWDGRIA